MSAHRLPQDEYDALSVNVRNVLDPGASGTIQVGAKGFAICEVVTAAAESRTLQSATELPAGTKLLVIFKTDGGDLTLSSDDADQVLDTAGDVCEFVVTDNDGTNEWKVLNNSRSLPASAGTYEFLATETAADNTAGIIAIMTALDTAGLIDASGITQAS